MDEHRKDLLNEQEILLTFLKRTKDGEYAEIDSDSMSYARIDEETIEVDEEYYYHNIS